MLSHIHFPALCRALVLVLLPIAFLPALSGCGTQAQNAINVQNILSEAKRHAEVDPDDKQARVWADRAIAVAPSDATTYFGDLHPSAVGQRMNIADILNSVGDDAAQADYMKQAVAKFPDDYRGYLLLADAQDRLGRTAECKATGLKLAALLTKTLSQPGVQDIPVVTDRLAQAYYYAGDLANSEAQYKKAMSAYPSLSSYTTDTLPFDFGPDNGLAYEYAETNVKLPEALALAQQAFTLAQRSSSDTRDIQVAVVQDTLGWVQHRLGDDKDAEQNLQEAASAAPREPEIRYHLGTVYAAEGKTDAAHSEFGHAILLAKDYLAAKQALAALSKSTTPTSS